MTITFPAQSLFERAVFDNGSGPPTPERPIETRLSAPSRIVVRIPAGSAPIDYDLPTLLDLAKYPLAVSPFANQRPPGSPEPTTEPPQNVTAIEAPWRLILSPEGTAVFTAARTPVTRNGRTELWHARATTSGQTPGQLPIRAIWTPDITNPLDPNDWAAKAESASLTPDHRKQIVRKSTTENPAQASLLLVSPMGTSLDLEAVWTSNGLIGWRHLSWLGRDNYVKTEEAGYLFPFGFPATLLSITERVFKDGLAFQRKRFFIVVRVPTVDYPAGLQTFAGRAQPFTGAATSTIVSPPLAELPQNDRFVSVLGANGAPTELRYQLALTTKDGRTVSADLPMIWVDDTTGENPGNLGTTMAAYAAAEEPLRTLNLGGQKVGFVEPKPPEPGVPQEDRALPTTAMLISARLATKEDGDRLAAFPDLVHADVHVEELDAFSGPAKVITRLSYEPEIYLDKGFGGSANPGDVWAKVATVAPPGFAAQAVDPLQFALSQAAGGGMAAPKFAVDALSRVHGTVTDLTNIAQNKFNPEEYFDLQDTAIKLLGAIPLREVIEIDDAPSLPSDQNIPKITTNRIGDDTVETVVTWKPKLKAVPVGTGKLCTFEPATTDPDRRLHLEVKITASADGSTTSVVRGELNNAALVFVEMIRQPIDRLRFESRDGGKPSIDLKLGTPEFKGDLRFLSRLKDLLPALPGGVKIDTTPTGVKAGLTLAVPSVPIGVVLVQNLAVGVLFDLPFNGDPARLFFSFGTREAPFRCTVMALGGGGFLTIGLSVNGGPPAIEGSLEFGAAVAIDLGVASGSVSIMAGIYIAFGPKTNDKNEFVGNTIVITGFIRAVGELSVLGLIHISLEFYLGLTFKKEGTEEGRVEGEATLKVRVEVFLFSTSVSVTLRKEIGSGVDPSFGDQISASDWSSYCAAFA
ncbi:hypothetical protein [Herbihabitans rhizosphaerae]|uniref:hypothetical protein n=1 Tax=Herbihabitans rhizosphaerae TaxID=1872711 RepID=UPI001A917C5C|nr:hypothetical protein [Herbihabitans rhizosphaerae]